jgi:hypothetical protein
MGGHVKFMYELLNCTMPNRTTWSHTKACIKKSSCEFSTLLGYYAVLSGYSLPMVQDDLSVPSSRVKEFKREKRAWLELTHTVFYFGTLFVI